MVEESPRFQAVVKHLPNTFTATLIARDLCETLAKELETYAETLSATDDPFGQSAGLHKAAAILRQGNDLDGGTFQS